MMILLHFFFFLFFVDRGSKERCYSLILVLPRLPVEYKNWVQNLTEKRTVLLILVFIFNGKSKFQVISRSIGFKQV